MIASSFTVFLAGITTLAVAVAVGIVVEWTYNRITRG